MRLALCLNCAIEYNQRMLRVDGALTDEDEDEKGTSSSESEPPQVSFGGRAAETELRRAGFDDMVRGYFKKRKGLLRNKGRKMTREALELSRELPASALSSRAQLFVARQRDVEKHFGSKSMPRLLYR